MAAIITPAPRIYCACLAAYSAGYRHGKWINAAQDAEDIVAEVQATLATSPITRAEEWAIHDYEGFGGYRVSEWEPFETVSKLALAIAEHGPIVGALADHVGTVDEAIAVMTARFRGAFDTIEHWAEETVTECWSLPELALRYFDWTAFARDAMLGGEITVIELDGKAHILTPVNAGGRRQPARVILPGTSD
jgi:antirestriction protein